jgi:mRNA-degrading endonuclease YafQ of YafQ-DinJ toxin-antitoxin module
MLIGYTNKFEREYKKLSEELKFLVEERTNVFRAHPFDPILKTHKLHGHLRDQWSFSVDFRHRIIFRFAENDTAIFLDVGDHEMYQSKTAPLAQGRS